VSLHYLDKSKNVVACDECDGKGGGWGGDIAVPPERCPKCDNKLEIADPSYSDEEPDIEILRHTTPSRNRGYMWRPVPGKNWIGIPFPTEAEALADARKSYVRFADRTDLDDE
jgi:hypothetical protein